MCGFAGAVAFDGRFSVDPPTLQRMSAAIAHRGPDGQGTWFSPDPAGPRVALAHRRLAILDPDPRSNQPFTNGRQWLVFNGEIYNFADLRRQLPRRDWTTSGDTEVLLAAYETWGEKCVDHLNGMFALAIWDSQRNSLFLARDRMGQKPLYICVLKGEAGSLQAVAFASEIAGLAPLAWLDRGVDRPALLEYLRWGYIPQPMTIHRGIRQLAPAQSLLATSRGLTERIYFQPDSPSGAGVAGDPIGATRQLVQQAVRRQLVSDVPLGCFLSGGIDSSVIAAAMKAVAPKDQPVLTFCIGFDDPRYDETQFAAAVARHLKTEHRAFMVRPNAAELLPRIAQAFGQPMGDSSALPTYCLAAQTRQHVKAALSGDGGDELFGGYDRYRALRLIAATGPLPWRAISPLISRLPGRHPKSALARLKRLAATAAWPEARRYADYLRLMDEPLLRSLLIQPPESPGPDAIEQSFAALRQTRRSVQAALAVDRRTYLPDDLLTKVDRCSMRHALEVRSPFLDPDLVAFAAQLEEIQLIGRKRLLRRAFAADLPGWVFSRPKMGFAVPIGDWLRGPLRPMTHDLLLAADSLAAGQFRRPALEAMLGDHQSGRRDHSQRLYALLMLELWWKGQN
jgi:asparagine synthase (glutamine-hydrolysing)